MTKEVEIYNLWFKNEEDHTQANILNAIKMGLDSSVSNNGNTLVSGSLFCDCGYMAFKGICTACGLPKKQ